MEHATEILIASRNGSRSAASKLLPLVYEKLKGLAGGLLARERVDHTLTPTALVHEVYLKLVDQTRAQWADRNHFIAVAAEAMRRILVDHARGHGRLKHGGGRKKQGLDSVSPVSAESEVDLVALGEALDRLSVLDERKRRVVELRYFVGLGNDETAEVLGVSRATVANDWTIARAWLRAELSTSDNAVDD